MVNCGHLVKMAELAPSCRFSVPRHWIAQCSVFAKKPVHLASRTGSTRAGDINSRLLIGRQVLAGAVD